LLIVCADEHPEQNKAMLFDGWGFVPLPSSSAAGLGETCAQPEREVTGKPPHHPDQTVRR
jgi:hypothetical protein